MTVRQEEHEEPGDGALHLISYAPWGKIILKKVWVYQKGEYVYLGSPESHVEL